MTMFEPTLIISGILGLVFSYVFGLLKEWLKARKRPDIIIRTAEGEEIRVDVTKDMSNEEIDARIESVVKKIS